MENSVIVYRSRREQMMDEFWMSEEGYTVDMILFLFLLAALGAAWLYENLRARRRGML